MFLFLLIKSVFNVFCQHLLFMATKIYVTRIISCEIVKSNTQNCWLMLTFISVFEILGWFLYWLNYRIKISVECWPNSHVQYCLIISFSTVPNNFATNILNIFFHIFFFYIYGLSSHVREFALCCLCIEYRHFGRRTVRHQSSGAIVSWHSGLCQSAHETLLLQLS